MAKTKSPEEMAALAEKKKIEGEKRELKRQQQNQKKEAKKRAKEIAKREDALLEEEEGNGLLTFGATLLIVALWIAVVCVIVKLDVGGFGSSVLTPILKDVPVLNLILPGSSLTETANPENYGGYTNLKEAVDQIRNLELELEQAQTTVKTKNEELDALKAEVIRLQEFEQRQVDFQRIRTEFYEEVVYAEKGPGLEAYQKFYEAMDPATAEFIYKQVIIKNEETKEVQDYAAAYATMKPKAAAGIFEKMTDNLGLVARILSTMSNESRGDILGVMDPTVAAKITKIMDPES